MIGYEIRYRIVCSTNIDALPDTIDFATEVVSLIAIEIVHEYQWQHRNQI